MNKINLNFLSIVGYAGQGKDTVKNTLIKSFDNIDFESIVFAKKMKEQLVNVIPEEIIIKTGEIKNKSRSIDILKDELTDIKILKDYNTRELLQKLGTEFYRSIDPDIHIRFAALEILNKIEKKPKIFNNYMFISSDTRFPNELDFILKIAQLKDKEKEIDFLKYYLSKTKKIIEYSELKNHFENVFQLKIENSELAENLLNVIHKDIKELNKNYEYKKDWDFLKVPETFNLSIKESVKKGLFHIFRPILPNDEKLKNLNKDDLINEIKIYTNLDDDKILKIKKCYEKYNIEFNFENISKYGFIRADVNHYSEYAINDRKPKFFISKPCKNKDDFLKLENDILNNFKNNKPTKRYKI